MSDTLATVRTRVLSHLNSSKDTVVAEATQAIRGSISWLERNNTFQYMDRFVTFCLDPTADNPRVIALPSNPKRLNFVRQVVSGADGSATFTYLNRISADDVTAIGIGAPTGFWMDGVQHLWFDCIPDSVLNYEMSYARVTGPLQDEDTHYLFDYAPDVIVFHTVLKMSPYLREPKLITMYKQEFDREIKALLDFDEELRHSGKSVSMRYGVEYAG